MRILLFILCLSTISFFPSCSDDCDDFVCTTPPDELAFVLIDSNTGKNIIETGQFTLDDISIISEFNDQPVKLLLEETMFLCPEIGWQTGAEKKDYILTVGEKTYKFIYHTEAKTVNCCALLGKLEAFSSQEFSIGDRSSAGAYELSLDLE